MRRTPAWDQRIGRRDIADNRHMPRLLRPRDDRPCRRPAEKRDKLAPPDAEHELPARQTLMVLNRLCSKPIVSLERSTPFTSENLRTNSSTGLPGGGWIEKSRVSSGWRQKSPCATSLKPAASTSCRSAASSIRCNDLPTDVPSPGFAE